VIVLPDGMRVRNVFDVIDTVMVASVCSDCTLTGTMSVAYSTCTYLPSYLPTLDITVGVYNQDHLRILFIITVFTGTMP
jgi:hypothetical protein